MNNQTNLNAARSIEKPKNLPAYKHPPVHETAMGVQFEPIQNWVVPHFGLFWEGIRNQYPLTETHEFIISSLESEELRFNPPDPTPILLPPDAVRCWFMTQAKSELLQVQKDRFIRTWRKVTGQEDYPRYDRMLRAAFKKDLEGFVEFAQSQGLGDVKVEQCDLMYINHLDQDEGWTSFEDLPKVFASWSGSVTEGFLPAPEIASYNAAYRLPNGQGRLRASLEYKMRTRDQKRILELRLVARGRPNGPGVDGVLDWMDMAREWIVRGFTDLTTPQMHKIWQRYQ